MPVILLSYLNHELCNFILEPEKKFLISWTQKNYWGIDRPNKMDSMKCQTKKSNPGTPIVTVNEYSPPLSRSYL